MKIFCVTAVFRISNLVLSIFVNNVKIRSLRFITDKNVIDEVNEDRGRAPHGHDRASEEATGLKPVIFGRIQPTDNSRFLIRLS